METGRSRKALGDAPDVGNDFHHIFEIFETGLQFYIFGIRAARANRAIEGRKYRV